MTLFKASITFFNIKKHLVVGKSVCKIQLFKAKSNISEYEKIMCCLYFRNKLECLTIETILSVSLTLLN
jgi:hypothetical protein